MSQYLLASLSYFSAAVGETACKHGYEAVLAVAAEERVFRYEPFQKGVTSLPEPAEEEEEEEETRVAPSWGCCSPAAMALALACNRPERGLAAAVCGLPPGRLVARLTRLQEFCAGPRNVVRYRNRPILGQYFFKRKLMVFPKFIHFSKIFCRLFYSIDFLCKTGRMYVSCVHELLHAKNLQLK
jgi:hypothetical protein